MVLEVKSKSRPQSTQREHPATPHLADNETEDEDENSIEPGQSYGTLMPW